jgi:CHAD domain-containing protein
MTSVDMRSVARAKVSKALDDVAVGIYTAARDPDAEAVHKLRVSIRRFTQAVRVFRQYVPKSEVHRITTRLGKLMKASGQVSDRDILIGLVESEDIDKTALEAERAAARQTLADMTRRIQNAGIPRRWRTRLMGGRANAVA